MGLADHTFFQRTLLAWVVVGAFLISEPSLWGHELGTTEVVLTLYDNGRFELSLAADFDALALGGPGQYGDHSHQDSVLPSGLVLNSLKEEELEAVARRLEGLLRRRIKLRADGVLIDTKVAFPYSLRTGLKLPLGGSVFGGTARLLGVLAPATQEVVVAVSRSFRTVELVVKTADGTEIGREILQGGGRSQPVSLEKIVSSREDG